MVIRTLPLWCLFCTVLNRIGRPCGVISSSRKLEAAYSVRSRAGVPCGLVFVALLPALQSLVWPLQNNKGRGLGSGLSGSAALCTSRWSEVVGGFIQRCSRSRGFEEGYCLMIVVHSRTLPGCQMLILHESGDRGIVCECSNVSHVLWLAYAGLLCCAIVGLGLYLQFACAGLWVGLCAAVSLLSCLHACGGLLRAQCAVGAVGYAGNWGLAWPPWGPVGLPMGRYPLLGISSSCIGSSGWHSSKHPAWCDEVASLHKLAPTVFEVPGHE